MACKASTECPGRYGLLLAIVLRYTKRFQEATRATPESSTPSGDTFPQGVAIVSMHLRICGRVD